VVFGVSDTQLNEKATYSKKGVIMTPGKADLGRKETKATWSVPVPRGAIPWEKNEKGEKGLVVAPEKKKKRTVT